MRRGKKATDNFKSVTSDTIQSHSRSAKNDNGDSDDASISATPTAPPPRFVHSAAIHINESLSPLSHGSANQDYRGFQNLIMLLLFVNNIRLIFENYIKYGILIKFSYEELRADEVMLSVLLCLYMPLSAIAAFIVEKLMVPAESKAATTASSRFLRNGAGLLLHLLNVLMVLLIPNSIAYSLMRHPLLILVPSFLSVVQSLKLSSWMLVFEDLRHAEEACCPILGFCFVKMFTEFVFLEYGKDLVYPKNLTLSNLGYFMLAPTLCYQPSYPRSPRFRISFFLKRILEIVMLTMMIFFIGEQYSRPTLRNSMRSFDSLNFGSMVERILKLSIPSIYIWLLLFYALFHSFLNAIAELLRFGDRDFYKPWWNARTISEYWRLWNLPVYRWFKRHVYFPLVTKHRMPRVFASILAFFISAIFHEILIGVPTRVVHGWAFLAMMSQVPLIWLTGMVQLVRPQFFDGQVGNFLFWISFCVVGQPLISILFYRAWYMQQYPELVAAAAIAGS